MKHLKRINENISMPGIFQEIKGYEVDADNLSVFIKEKYGKMPEIEASLEMGHDETREMFADAGSYNSDEDDVFYQWLEKPKYCYSEISCIGWQIWLINFYILIYKNSCG